MTCLAPEILPEIKSVWGGNRRHVELAPEGGQRHIDDGRIERIHQHRRDIDGGDVALVRIAASHGVEFHSFEG